MPLYHNDMHFLSTNFPEIGVLGNLAFIFSINVMAGYSFSYVIKRTTNVIKRFRRRVQSVNESNVPEIYIYSTL